MGYKFKNIDLPNVAFTPTDPRFNADPNLVCMLDEFLVPLAKKVAVQHPDWNIEGLGGKVNRDGIHMCGTLVMKEKNRLVGSVDMGNRYRRKEGKWQEVNLFVLRSHNIKTDNHQTKTEKIELALKTINKTFAPKQDNQIMLELTNRARGMLQGAQNNNSMWRAVSELSADKNRLLQQRVVAFLQEHEDEIAEPLSAEHKQEFSKVTQLLRKMEIVHSVNYETGIAVYLENGKWYTAWYENDATRQSPTKMLQVLTYDEDSATIPEHVRNKVGMLKLIDAGNVIENVGMKVQDNLFLITPEK